MSAKKSRSNSKWKLSDYLLHKLEKKHNKSLQKTGDISPQLTQQHNILLQQQTINILEKKAEKSLQQLPLEAGELQIRFSETSQSPVSK